jgi:hypothetical protein
METEKSTSTGNKVTLKYQFDEQTKRQVKLRHFEFSHDKKYKILSFTGKVEKKKVQTELEGTPGKYITHYLFECYDITPTPSSEVTNDMLAIWECGRRDARTTLNLLSKNFTELDIVCDGQHNSETATYLIYPRVEDIHT